MLKNFGRYRGPSILETLTALAVLGILVLSGAPSFVRWRQQQAVEAAVRHLELLFTRVCAAAVASGRTHAVQFDPDGADLRWVAVVDGDGVTRADLAAHVDVPLEAWSSLGMLFPGGEPGRPSAVPTVLGGAADRHGLAFGRSEVVSCAPTGGGGAFRHVVPALAERRRSSVEDLRAHRSLHAVVVERTRCGMERATLVNGSRLRGHDGARVLRCACFRGPDVLRCMSPRPNRRARVLARSLRDRL